MAISFGVLDLYWIFFPDIDPNLSNFSCLNWPWADGPPICSLVFRDRRQRRCERGRQERVAGRDVLRTRPFGSQGAVCLGRSTASQGDTLTQ